MPEIVTNSLASKYPELSAKFSDSIIAVEEFRGDLSVQIRPEKIRDVVAFIKHQLQFEIMMDLFGMDYLKYTPEHPERFAVVYIFYSLTLHVHLRVKVYLSETAPELDSIHDLYAAANWNEREAWDLFGVVFKGHPNLIRILCHNDFEGHPLRKDYPSDQYQRLKNASSSTGF